MCRSAFHDGAIYKLQIHESTIHRIIVARVVLMEAILPCFNLKPDDCNFSTTILIHKLPQLRKTLLLEKLWLEFLRLEWGGLTNINM